MENEECAQRDAYFKEELESLKTSVAHLTSLLEQTLRNTSDEGPLNRSVTFDPTPTTVQPEERIANMVRSLSKIQHLCSQRHLHQP